jgi:hypothetical protein
MELQFSVEDYKKALTIDALTDNQIKFINV